MKTIHIGFEDDDFERLVRAKKRFNQRSWHNFIMLLAVRKVPRGILGVAKEKEYAKAKAERKRANAHRQTI